jgi:hypothetical protein
LGGVVINIICCVDKDWNIASCNGLQFPISEDMLFFKHITLYKVVITDIDTFIGLGGKSRLKNRLNLISCQKTDERAKWHLKLPKNEKLAVKERLSCIFLNNILDLQRTLTKFDSEIIYFIDRQSIFQFAVKLCYVAYLT